MENSESDLYFQTALLFIHCNQAFPEQSILKKQYLAEYIYKHAMNVALKTTQKQ